MEKKMINYIKRCLGRTEMKKPEGYEIIDFINQNWRNQTCQICGEHTWNVSDKIYELREFNDGDIVIGGPGGAVFPVIPVVCKKCGNTIFINAVSTKLLKGE